MRLTKVVVFLLAFLSPVLSGARKKVVLTEEQRQALGLPPSPYYIVYTADEDRQILEAIRAQKKLVELLELKSSLLEQNVGDLKLVLRVSQDQLKLWHRRSDFLFDTWKRCDRDLQLAKAGSWWPWVITGVALVGALAASSVAVYYATR